MKNIIILLLLTLSSCLYVQLWQQKEGGNIYFKSGTVSIGCDSIDPGAKLQVVSHDSNNGLPLMVSRTHAGGSNWGIQQWHNNKGEVMRVTFSGNMGIGDREPKEKLVVDGSILIKGGSALILTCGNGKEFRITVDTSGNLKTEAIQNDKDTELR